MADNRIPSQWQLQETGDTRSEWMLHEDEQRLPDHMQLQEDVQPVAPESAWQPIDYRAMQQAAAKPRSRGGAALATLVVLALLGAAGYMTWYYFGGSNSAATADEPVAALAAPTVEATVPPVDATAMPMAETAAAAAVVPITAPVELPAPTPTLSLVTVKEATVTEEYGVNARREPRGDADLLQVLEKGAVLQIASGPTKDASGSDWYEVALADKSRAWVSGNFVQLSSRQLPLAEATALLTGVGLESLIPSPEAIADAGAKLGAVITDTVTSTGTGTLTGTLPITGSGALTGALTAGGVLAGAQITDTAAPTLTAPLISAAAPITVSGTISAPAGLNLRRSAEAGDNVITLLADKAPVSVIGRSTDGSWVQVQTADGTRGWISADFISAPDVAAIPLGTTQALTPTVPLVAPAAPTAAAAPAAPAAPAAAPAATPSAAALIPTPTPLAATAGAAASSTPAVTLPTPTPAGAATPVATSAPLPVAADGSVGTLTVSSVLGVNVRPAPSQDSPAIIQLPWNETAQILGRTGDLAWVKVRLTDGRTGWVASSAVSLPSTIDALPVLQ